MTRAQMERRIIDALPTLSLRGLRLVLEMLDLFPGLRQRPRG